MDEIQPKTIEEMIMANNAYIQNIFHQITQMHVEILLLCHKVIPESGGRGSDIWATIVDEQAESSVATRLRSIKRVYMQLKMNHAGQ